MERKIETMSQTVSRTASVLSIVVATLAAGAALAGLIFPDLYQDPAANLLFSRAYWLGNDIVTLVLAVPLFVAALVFARRGLLRARLVWLGMAYFTIYNYSFHLFGADLNWFYPLHAALVVLPVFMLVFGLADTDVAGLSWSSRSAKSLRWIAGYMLIVAMAVTVTWIMEWRGVLSADLVDTDKADFARTVGGLDMWLAVSSMVLGAVLLWKRRPWGYVVATMANVSFGLYMLVMVVVSCTEAAAAVQGALSELPLWIVLSLGGLIASLILLCGLPRAGAAPHPERLVFLPE
jgi:hypothetical protein